MPGSTHGSDQRCPLQALRGHRDLHWTPTHSSTTCKCRCRCLDCDSHSRRHHYSMSSSPVGHRTIRPGNFRPGNQAQSTPQRPDIRLLFEAHHAHGNIVARQRRIADQGSCLGRYPHVTTVLLPTQGARGHSRTSPAVTNLLFGQPHARCTRTSCPPWRLRRTILHREG